MEVMELMLACAWWRAFLNGLIHLLFSRNYKQQTQVRMLTYVVGLYYQSKLPQLSGLY